MPNFNIKCLVSGSETDGKVAVFEEVVKPGAGPPRHTHRDQIEVFHVMSGTFQFEVDGEVIERSTGGTAVVPAKAVHAFRNVGDTTGTVRFELLPAGNSEEFFHRIVNEEIEDFRTFFNEYGLDLSGPPMG
ncbi:MAG: hypothetical protein CMO55_00295 [Verrucomicrobiales bacterium]|nr:hypothetical protein [Verrucomicrobiales bacterium]